MAIVVPIKGVIISNDQKWIYDWFELDAVCPKDVEKCISKANGDDLELHINSPGGDVYVGSEIYATIKDYQGKSVSKILGRAASAAGVVACGTSKTLIAPTAQIMIHNVSSIGSGDYRAFEHEAEVLKNYNVSIANAYRLKTGLAEKDLLELMNNETWMNAQRAIDLGFADEIMFDDSNILVNSAEITLGMIQPKVIAKMRTHLKKESKNNQSINLAKARLNLLRLKESGIDV